MSRRRPGINGPMLTFVLLGILGVAGLWGNIQLVHERRALRTEVAAWRGEPRPLAPGESTTTGRDITTLSTELAQEISLLEKAEAKLVALQQTVPPVEN